MSKTEIDPQRQHIILVEDDNELASLICDFLSKYEFDVSVIGNGIDAEQQILEQQPDLVILDVMLPGQSGMEVCKRVRDSYQGLILMQTALDEDIDQMMGLDLGADDYIVKQVQPRLLLSRIRALLRRAQPQSPEQAMTSNSQEVAGNAISASNITIDLAARSVTLKGQEITLTTAEFELLCLLATSPGQVVTRDDIIQQIRGFEYDGLDRSVDRRISRLRKKLQDDSAQPVLIKTVRGQGYQLCL